MMEENRFVIRSEERGDDTLIRQIDEFREKAKQLQTLINARQQKVIALESMVREREDALSQKDEQLAEKEYQISILQEKLAKKQREADGLVSTVEAQVDRMLEDVRGDLQGLEDKIASRVISSVPDREVEVAFSEEARDMQATLDKVSADLEGIKSGLETQTPAEPVENPELAEKLTEIFGKIGELESIKSDLSVKIDSAMAEMREAMENGGQQTGAQELEAVKTELSEKIHSENVKVFRNIQDTLKEMDLKEEMDLSLEVRYRSLRNRVFWATTMIIINLGLSVVLLLAYLQIIH